MKGLLRLVVVFVLSLGLFSFAGGDQNSKRKTITIKGSDTMVILGQRWAEDYMKSHPDIIVQVTGGGSGTGIAALINGSTDICQASRPLKDEENKLIIQKRGKGSKEIPVAQDGIAIYCNEKNPVISLTIEQLKQIYQGKINNWSQLGWDKKEIVLYGRENNSGTYTYFKEHVLKGEDFYNMVQSLPGTAAVVNAISKDKYSIGYGGMAYAKGIKEIGVKKDDKSPALLPSIKNIVSGVYPVSRKLYFYTVAEPAGVTKDFIEWVLAKEGQEICQEVGYVCLKK
ncbi:MAG: PstS family phosphate ABC transporter substrate-binding protein [Elusimicrobia bacterium]|nr:PstS family phosphate ABC transporter substrate-binding protein [Candidatus Liberimonas magnetica]